MKIKISSKLLILTFSSFFIFGCNKNNGPFEKTGERMDEIQDNVEKGKPILHKSGPLEKAGEAIDESLTTKE